MRFSQAQNEYFNNEYITGINVFFRIIYSHAIYM